MADRIRFKYDSAGNQERRYVCLCNARIANDTTSYKTKETIVENDLIHDSEFEQLSYYPNPVREELYVKWENVINNPIVEMQLYSISGQILKSQNNLVKDEITTINFQNYPTGMYNLILIYTNGEKKSLKIVKQ